MMNSITQLVLTYDIWYPSFRCIPWTLVDPSFLCYHIHFSTSTMGGQVFEPFFDAFFWITVNRFDLQDKAPRFTWDVSHVQYNCCCDFVSGVRDLCLGSSRMMMSKCFTSVNGLPTSLLKPFGVVVIALNRRNVQQLGWFHILQNGYSSLLRVS